MVPHDVSVKAVLFGGARNSTLRRRLEPPNGPGTSRTLTGAVCAAVCGGGFGLTRAHARAGLLRPAEVAAVDQPAYGVGERVAQWAWGEAELAASVRVVVAGGALHGPDPLALPGQPRRQAAGRRLQREWGTAFRGGSGGPI